jgi:hypothetical protein
MDLMTSTPPTPAKVLFETPSIKVLDVNGKTVTQSSDVVICLPYLVERASLLFRYMPENAFSLVNPTIDKYVTALNVIVQDGETPVEAVKSGLKYVYGIELKNFAPEIQPAMFVAPGSATRYHVCIMPLMNHNFEQIQPEESMKLQMMNSNVIFQTNELSNLIIYDIMTKYTIDIFKDKYLLY